MAWNKNQDECDTSAHDLFDDLFKDWTNFPVDEAMNELVLGDTLSFFGIGENGVAMNCNEILPTPQPNLTPKSLQRPSRLVTVMSDVMMTQCQTSTFTSPVYASYSSQGIQRTTSLDYGYSSEDPASPSDTDSEIHSPGAMKSPFDDVLSWWNDRDVFELDPPTFSQPSPSRVSLTDSEASLSPASVHEPYLLNMDEQEPCPGKFMKQDSPDLLPVEQSTDFHSFPRESKVSCNFDAGNWCSSMKPPIDAHSEKSPASPPCPTKTNTVTIGKRKKPRSRRPGKGTNKPGRDSSRVSGKTGYLWEFIRDLLLNPQYCPSIIKWEDRYTGIFRFVQTDAVAALWGKKKQNPHMTYEKLSRAMRFYYKQGILDRVDGRRLVYKFGSEAYGWQSDQGLLNGQSWDSGNSLSSLALPSTSLSRDVSMTSKCIVPVTSEIGRPSYELTTEVPSISLPSASVLLEKTKKFCIK